MNLTPPQRFLVRCAIADAVLLTACGLLMAPIRVRDLFPRRTKTEEH